MPKSVFYFRFFAGDSPGTIGFWDKTIKNNGLKRELKNGSAAERSLKIYIKDKFNK